MTDSFDDDSDFWDRRHDEPTIRLPSLRCRSVDRTRAHGVVSRGERSSSRSRSSRVGRGEAAAPYDHTDEQQTIWVEPRLDRATRRLGALAGVDPRLLSVGAIALAAVLAVPLFAAFDGSGDRPEAMRSIAAATTTTLAPATTVAVATTEAGDTDDEADVAAAVDESAGANVAGASSGTATPSPESGDGDGGSPAADVLSAPAVRSAAQCGNPYEVQLGDYWLLLADAVGASLDELLDYNEASVETPLFPGSIVCLPLGASIAATTTAPAASSTSAPASSLAPATANASASSGAPATAGASATAATGDSTSAPAPESTEQSGPACANSYEVRSGDFWLRLANAAGTRLDDLLDLNGATVDTALYPGSIVCLPAGATVSSGGTGTPASSEPATQVPATTRPTTTRATTTEPATTEPATTAETRPPVSVPDGGAVEAMIRDVWADDAEEMALRIAWRESNYRSDVTSGTGCCVGVFQIHWEAHRGWLADLGITERSQLFDARTNVTAAYVLYQRNGWSPWPATYG